MINLHGILSKHRKLFSVSGMLILVALIFWTVNSPAIVGASATQRQLPVYSVQRSDKAAAISFDAAWGNETGWISTLSLSAPWPRPVMKS